MPDEGWKAKLLAREVAGKGSCVLARARIEAEETIGWFEGEEVSKSSQHSVYLEGKNIHGTGILRNLAHSCEPNARFRDRGRWLVALVAIDVGTEVTIDYLDTEPTIGVPFTCRCGSPRCRGFIGTPRR